MYAKNRNVIFKNKNKEIIGKLLGIDNKGNLQIQVDKKIINISDINYSMRLLG